MRVALAVLRVVADPQANKDRILTFIREAAAGGAGLVLFPETATTGLVNNDNPNHDYPLAEPIPNPFLAGVAQVARAAGLHVGLGTIERDGCAIYESFVLFSNTGALVVHYR
jgi:predicted amidohydrolase